MSNIFTPRDDEAGIRLRLSLSDADMAKIHPKRRWQATVTDRSTGNRYKVRGCACTIRGCRCDAVVTATQTFKGTIH
jgi:hypothetical protein